MWKFVDLNDEEKALRRQNLDAYGQVAQLSALIPLLLVLLWSVAKWSGQRFWPHDDILNPPGSPYAKYGRSSVASGLGFRVKRAWRRFRWWCADELRLGTWTVGSKGELLGGMLWATWLAYLCIADTGDGMSYSSIERRLRLLESLVLAVLCFPRPKCI
jgi:hypothetical protein